jgi:hypothetical protein
LTVFSGAGFIGLIFFSAIEISKIIATSAIHTYGKKIGWVYNSLLSLGIIIAMGITSMGVYGFLSSGYEKNSAKSDNVNRKIQLIDNQVKLKEKSRESVNTQLLQVQNSITQLRTALGNNTQSRVDRKGNVITTSSAGNRKAFESQLKIATESEQRLSKDLSLIDSTINVLSEDKLDIESKEATTNELGPLKYLAEITGTSMDNVMKWFILLLIFIGDPMAILMIIIFNKIINGDVASEGITDVVNEVVTDVVDEVVTDEVNELVTDGVNELVIDEVNEEPIEEVDEEPIVEFIENDEPTKEEDLKPVERVIRVEDLPERSNRGFSVNIPDRKQSNLVERIGSNKEIREENPSKVFFKKRL